VNKLIIAAGAVVWRLNNLGQTEIAVIHRPKYNDWSFPKGKVDIGESVIACAHREVLEESNLDTQFGPFLGEVEYMTLDGAKKVYFWSAKAVKEYPFIPNSEVDKLEWHNIKSANKLLSLETDKQILKIFSRLTLESKPFILLRHAKAITREEWQGDDDDRPLDSLGIFQSDRLIPIYSVYKIDEVHTSDALRCFDTVNQFARKLQIKLEVNGKLSESTYKKDKDKAIDYCKDLLKEEKSVLICSHNPILPKLLNKLTKKSEVEADDEKLQPADSWVIHRVGKEIIQVDRLDAPKA
jgi:8-oxo-dGTP diphosphatase